MKPTALYLILSVCLLTASCRRQQVVKEEPKAQIEFLTDLRYDFSDEGMKDTVTHWFVYRNTGSVPFVINSIETQCGCTTVSFSKEPLAPGGTDSIQVMLSLKKLIGGYLYKSCNVYSNAADSVIRLTMQGQHVRR